MDVMSRASMTRLPTAVLLLGIALALSGCNTISGAVGGAGQDIASIGNALSGVARDDCRGDRCGKRRAYRDCGPRGCRELRRTATECLTRDCRRWRDRVSYRDRSYSYRDSYRDRYRY